MHALSTRTAIDHHNGGILFARVEIGGLDQSAIENLAVLRFQLSDFGGLQSLLIAESLSRSKA